MGLTAEQRRNAATIIATGRRMGASDGVILSALATGLVESNLTNVNHGDRDSLGVFQQRPSQGWGTPQQVTNVAHAAASYFSRAKANEGKYKDLGALAQSVQRSAFPDRYSQRLGEAKQILASVSGTEAPSIGSSALGRSKVSITPGKAETTDKRQALIDALLQGGRGKGGTLLGRFNSNVASGRYTTPGTDDKVKVTPGVEAGQIDTSGAPVVQGKGHQLLFGLAKIAEQKFGLHVGELAGWHGTKLPKGGHAPNSWHYQGRAADISGDPKQMAAFANYVATHYQGQLKELFWQGHGGVNVKNGQRVAQGFVSGHQDHVHLAI